MHCANPDCGVIAEELFKGMLALVEFEATPENRISYAAGGFPVCSTRTKYFWLCERCALHFTIRKWNSRGLILEPVHGNFQCIAQIRLRNEASRTDAPEHRTHPERLQRMMRSGPN
jgi:hypothetical protein